MPWIRVSAQCAKEIDLAKGAEERHKLESATSHVLGYGVGVVYTRFMSPCLAQSRAPAAQRRS